MVSICPRIFDTTADGIIIHQSTYAKQILNRFGFGTIKSVSTPLESTTKLIAEKNTDASKEFQHQYLSKIGSINHLQTKTRIDLSFAVSATSRFMKNPNQSHMDAVNREYAFLKGRTDVGLYYKKSGNVELEGFVDSDWGGDTDTGKSTTGWVYTLAGSPVSWSSQRQQTVATSSTTAEYVAASDACKEALWLKGFMNIILLNMGLEQQSTVTLHIDNASAIKLAKNPESHGRTKHINIRHHFIRECIERGDVTPKWISGKENVADILTKPLPKALFVKIVNNLGLYQGKELETNTPSDHEE